MSTVASRVRTVWPVGRSAVWFGDPSRALMVFQIAAIVVLGAVTVFRFHIFAEVDERAHLAYVQEVAEHGRIPWVGRDYVSWQELAIEADTYPRPSKLDPRVIGLRGSSYEGWQPPLYYMLAAPAYLIPNNYRDKVVAVRAFDLLLLMLAVGILALLARAVFTTRWRVPYCLALGVILWPGVIVRAVTISNAALEMPLVLLYLLAIWEATRRPRTRWLVAAGVLLGLMVLTQLTLVCLAVLMLLPLGARLRGGRDLRTLGGAAVALALPLVLVAPWFALNEGRYGALTASSIEERLTASFNPGGPRSGVGAIISGLGRLTRVVLPQEWWREYRGAVGVVVVVLAIMLVAALLPLVRRPALLRSLIAGALGAPLLLGLLTLAGIVLLADWPAALFPRYLNPMLAPFVLFTAWTWKRIGTGDGPLLSVAALSSCIVGLVWVYMAGAYYFTHAGATLGIHAS